MREYVHIGCVKDGAIVMFDKSPCCFMKVCDRYGQGGVVRLFGGQYIATKDLSHYGLDFECWVEYNDIDEMYREGDNWND